MWLLAALLAVCAAESGAAQGCGGRIDAVPGCGAMTELVNRSVTRSLCCHVDT